MLFGVVGFIYEANQDNWFCGAHTFGSFYVCLWRRGRQSWRARTRTFDGYWRILGINSDEEKGRGLDMRKRSCREAAFLVLQHTNNLEIVGLLL